MRGSTNHEITISLILWWLDNAELPAVPMQEAAGRQSSSSQEEAAANLAAAQARIHELDAALAQAHATVSSGAVDCATISGCCPAWGPLPEWPGSAYLPSKDPTGNLLRLEVFGQLAYKCFCTCWLPWAGDVTV